MVSTQKPIFAIGGATGFQGKSVLAEAHKTGKYHIRALTRNPKSETAQKLAADFSGIELVASNNNDVKSLVAALTGAEYAFFVTNFWDTEEKQDPETDYRQGKNMADAAKEAGVKFVVWSSAHDVKTLSKGTLEAHHFSQKNRVEGYMKSIGLDFVAVYAGFYAVNWEKPGSGFTRQKDGTVVVYLPFRPDVGVPIIDTEADYGKFVAFVLQDPKKHSGKHVLAAAEYQTVPQMVADYTRITGEVVKIIPVPLESVPSKDLQGMFAWYNQYGFYNGELIDNDAFFGKDKPELNNFGGWVKRTGFKVPQ